MEGIWLTLAQLGTIVVAYLAIRYVLLPIYRSGALNPAVDALRKVDVDQKPPPLVRTHSKLEGTTDPFSFESKL